MLASSEKEEVNIDKIVASYALEREMTQEGRKDMFTKVIAARALLQGKRTDSYPIILDWIAQNPNNPASLDALQGISVYNNDEEDFTKLLETGLITNNNTLRNKISSILVSVVEKSKKTAELSEQIELAFTKAETLEAKTFLIEVGAATGESAGLNMIKEGLRSTNVDLVRATYISLENWPNDQAVDLVLDRIKSTSSTNPKGIALRKSAIASLLKLLRREDADGKRIGTKDSYNSLILLAKNDGERRVMINSMGAVAETWIVPLLEILASDSKGKTSERAKKAIDNVNRLLKDKN